MQINHCHNHQSDNMRVFRLFKLKVEGQQTILNVKTSYFAHRNLLTRFAVIRSVLVKSGTYGLI